MVRAGECLVCPGASTVWQEGALQGLACLPGTGLPGGQDDRRGAVGLLGFSADAQSVGGGVVGVLTDGPVKEERIRAELDSLPVAKLAGLPHASTETATGETGTTVGFLPGRRSTGAGRGSVPAQVLPTAVVDTLGREIVDGRRPPGSVLTLEQIQERFIVSRTVARDAMRSLESVRVVQPKRRVGLVVLPESSWDVFNPTLIGWRLSGLGERTQLESLTELLAAIAPFAASGAARHANRATRLRLVELARMMRRAAETRDLEGLLKNHIEFHQALLRASGNEMFAALAEVVMIVVSGRARVGLVSAQPADAFLSGHQAVARAINDHNPQEAERGMSTLCSENGGFAAGHNQ